MVPVGDGPGGEKPRAGERGGARAELRDGGLRARARPLGRRWARGSGIPGPGSPLPLRPAARRAPLPESQGES